MASRDLLKSAVVGIAVAVLVLVIGVAGQVAWVVWRLPGIHEGSGKIPVTSETTVMFDRSVTVSESYTDFRGLCAAALVILMYSTHVLYKPPPSSRPTPVAPADAGFTVQTSEDIVAVTTTAIRPPWYVTTLAGVALVTASGWQLRRSWRDRR
jgi:hypothetical protein